MVNLFFRYQNCAVYEIYPESKSPHLTLIGHLDFDPTKDPSAYLLPGKVIWYGFYEDRIIFRVWDYRLNHSISFCAEVNCRAIEFNLQVYFTLC